MAIEMSGLKFPCQEKSKRKRRRREKNKIIFKRKSGEKQYLDRLQLSRLLLTSSKLALFPLGSMRNSINFVLTSTLRSLYTDRAIQNNMSGCTCRKLSKLFALSFEARMGV